MTAPVAINLTETIQSRLSAGRVPRFGPVLVIVARPTLALLAQAVTLLIMTQLNVPRAGIAVRNWWTVYGTLVDLGCLGLLLWLTRREGIRLGDLIAFSKNRLKTDIPLGLGIFIIVFPVTIFGGGMLAQLIA
jgi:uncharacterized protein